MTTESIALTRARRGAAWLDKKLGPGWRRKIRRSRLNMSRAAYRPGTEDFMNLDFMNCGCILAQLAPPNEYGTQYYANGAVQLGLEPTGSYAVRLGFFTRDAMYNELTEAWKIVLREKP